MLSCPPDLSLLNQVRLRRVHTGLLSMKRLRLSVVYSLATIAALCLSFVVPLAQPRASARHSIVTQRPRLVLLIVVDQFRFDYLTRFGDLYGSKGIGRLMRQGASWINADYDHVPTYTAPGHARLMTGSWPWKTGIVGNDWFERETSRKVTSVTDDATSLLEGRAGARGYSPQRLLCSTVGDELRQASGNRAKVIGISAKARAAILPSGQHASAAYWFSLDNGNMVSSTFYFNRAPEWVTQFNQRRMTDAWFGARWERLLPEAEYLKRAGIDDAPWENLDKTSKDSNTFPHVVTGGAKAPEKAFYRAIDYTPFSNDLLEAFAEEAITREELGADDETDVLTISFSANDHVGHRFGPNSQEVMDMALRVDRQIGTLLDFVDQRVGLSNTVVIFTADHGVSPAPAYRASGRQIGRRATETDLRKAIEDGLKARYGRPGRPADDYIQTFGSTQEARLINSNIYLNENALRRDGIDSGEVQKVVGELAIRLPGVRRYFTRVQLEGNHISTADPIARRVRHGFYPSRSGDVVLVLDPYTFYFDPPDDPAAARWTATHGSPYRYVT